MDTAETKAKRLAEEMESPSCRLLGELLDKSRTAETPEAEDLIWQEIDDLFNGAHPIYGGKWMNQRL